MDEDILEKVASKKRLTSTDRRRVAAALRAARFERDLVVHAFQRFAQEHGLHVDVPQYVQRLARRVQRSVENRKATKEASGDGE